MKEEEFDSVINVNLKGTFNTTQQVSSIMLKQKSGTIINMSSVVGLTGNAGQANYAASKAGVIGLTKSVARELASRGITCNAIAPGFIETDMTDVLSDKVKEATVAQIPLKKLGQVEDIARAAVFLATNKYITGQVINVDGGMVMNG
jgi:3-oxoacyl-[acyl-carrier protein] reductase